MASRKRPRSNSSLPPDSINPLSRSQRQLKQFAVAGLGETDPDPAASVPFFPHRGVRSGPLLAPPEEQEEDGEKKRRTLGNSQVDKHVQTLLESIYHFLDSGHVAKAARAYGLILQLQPNGRPIDIRRHHLWAIGAEILMREGEIAPGDEGNEDRPTDPARRRQRWGSAANMGKVKAYFETLIQQHPYDHRRPNAISAIDFWLALLRCEIYNVQAEHHIALQSLKEEDYDEPPNFDMDMDDPEAFAAMMEERGAAAREEVREQAFLATREIAYRLSRLMQDQPYSGHAQLRELLVTVSSYMEGLGASTGLSSSRVVQSER
jgi:hypothetical protein